MLGAILVWTIAVGGGTAWTVFAVAAVVIGLGAIVKYAVPGRRLKEVGIPGSTLVLGAVLGVVGFFVIPVVGLLVGFVLGVYLAELSRVGATGGVARDGPRPQGRRTLDADRVHRLPARRRRLGRRSSSDVITVLFSLGAALAYGLSDFLGGVISRRTSVWPVAMLACAGAGLGTLVLAFTVPGTPTGADIAWGLLAGVGSGIGTAFLYRGFAKGRMGVVAPVSAVGAALLPAAIAVLTGERPEHPRVGRASSPHCPASGWSRAKPPAEPTPPAGQRGRASSTGSSPVPASACSSPPWARSPTARATGR